MKWLKNFNGKEYDVYKNVKFEGEYINGHKIKGKGYNNYGKVIFKLDKNGKSKEYYSKENIQFEGEYSNGKRWNGKGYIIKKIIEYEIKTGNGKIKYYYKWYLKKNIQIIKNGKGIEYDPW